MHGKENDHLKISEKRAITLMKSNSKNILDHLQQQISLTASSARNSLHYTTGIANKKATATYKEVMEAFILDRAPSGKIQQQWQQ